MLDRAMRLERPRWLSGRIDMRIVYGALRNPHVAHESPPPMGARVSPVPDRRSWPTAESAGSVQSNPQPNLKKTAE